MKSVLRCEDVVVARVLSPAPNDEAGRHGCTLIIGAL